MSATYASRIFEVHGLLQQIPLHGDGMQQKLNDFIDHYGSLRQSALNDLSDYLAKASYGNMGTQAKWQSRIENVKREYYQLFGDVAKDSMLPPAHQLFWANLIKTEDEFFDALAKIRTPQLMDDLLAHQNGLSQLAAALTESWSVLLSKNEDLKRDEMSRLQAMDELVQQVVSDMDNAARKAVDDAARVAEDMKRKMDELRKKIRELLGPVTVVTDAIIALIKKYIQDYITPDGAPDGTFETIAEWLKLQMLKAQAMVEGMQKYRALLASYKDLIQLQKGSVLTMFKDTRSQVEHYLDNNDVSKAAVWVDQAKGQLGDWISSVSTSGQKSDAAIFREDVSVQFDNLWKRTQEIDNKFREHFKGAFFSPLSNETVEALAQGFVFKEELHKIEDKRAPEKLETYQRSLGDGKSKIEDGLKAIDVYVDDMSSDKVPDEMIRYAQESREKFRSYVGDQIRRQIESLLPFIDDMKKLLTPDNLESDFGRKELEDMLR